MMGFNECVRPRRSLYVMVGTVLEDHNGSAQGYCLRRHTPFGIVSGDETRHHLLANKWHLAERRNDVQKASADRGLFGTEDDPRRARNALR